MKVQVYTYFGRILKEEKVPENRTHHETFENLRMWAVKTYGVNGKWWIRIK